MNDCFIAFFCGMLSGAIVGILLFSVILAMKMNEDRREEENDSRRGG